MMISSYTYIVLLDGKPIKNCLEYDAEEGFVKYYELDSEGKILMEDSKAKINTVWGKVEIKSMVDLITELNDG